MQGRASLAFLSRQIKTGGAVVVYVCPDAFI